MKLSLFMLVSVPLFLVACSEDATEPTKYGKVEGWIAVESLEKSPDNIAGDTLSIGNMDSLKVYVDGHDHPSYTREGAYSIADVPYGTHRIASEIIPDIRIESNSFVLDRDVVVLPDTLAYSYKYDSHPELVEIRYVIPNPFSVSNNTGFYISANMMVDVYIYRITGNEAKYLYHGELVGGMHVLTWDGRDNQSNQCEAGLYFFVVYGDGEFCSYITMMKE